MTVHASLLKAATAFAAEQLFLWQLYFWPCAVLSLALLSVYLTFLSDTTHLLMCGLDLLGLPTSWDEVVRFFNIE